MKNSNTIIEEYLNKNDWRITENSNSPYCFGAMQKHMLAEVSKDYWLRYVYPDKIAKAYVNGDIHIHDLGGLTLYCCGYSLKNIILMGVQGIPNIPTSAPAKHFDAILNQIANLVTIYQNEIMGAVAFNGFDTLLAPFIKKDNLTYKEVKQSMQNFIFSINSNSRAGAEPAFSNITFDLTPPSDMLDDHPFIGEEVMNFTYKDCQPEMDMLNKSFFELMMKGDAQGRPFAYPIPTYNIHKRFDWDNPNNDMLFEMAGRYGYPYFANFLNSDLDITDVRSMCCRLQLNLKELRKKNGGLFGAGDSTGSVGVTTINLPRLGYLYKGDKEALFKGLNELLVLAKDSLEIKRDWLQKNILDKKLIPAFMTYVGTIDNHFSTIGIVGMNELCENFLGKDILSKEGMDLCIEVSNYIRQRLVDFQEETGHLFNYEATPAESTAYRLAKIDKATYPDIITQGTKDAPYYTNSCHIPVKKIEGIKSTFDNQNEIQSLFTGGTVIHLYEEGAISGEQAKNIVRNVCMNYKVPYISISPINRYCSEHGYVKDKVDRCPICGRELEKYQRITGYIRNVKFFNPGKAQEFKEREQLTEKSE